MMNFLIKKKVKIKHKMLLVMVPVFLDKIIKVKVKVVMEEVFLILIYRYIIKYNNINITYLL